MKRALVSLLLIFSLVGVGVSSAYGQARKVKVVEKSSRKAPKWVSSSETDYIITSAFGNSIEEAKNSCMDNVRKSIISSVAQNVKLSSSSKLSQRMESSNVISSFEDYYSSQYETKAAEVPFLKGISDSKIEDYYWELQQDRSTKERKYYYTIKYPFPSLELKKLVREFEKRDQEMYSKLALLKERVGKVESLEEIDDALMQLATLTNYFFDDVRLAEVTELKEGYRALYGQIYFKPISQKLGEYKFQLMIGDRPIKTSQRAVLMATDTENVKSHIEGETVVVTYNYEGSEHDVDNEVNVILRVDKKPLKHSFTYRVDRHPVAVFLEKYVYLSADEVTDSLITDIEMRFELVSKMRKPYIVKSLFIEVYNLKEPIAIDDIDVALEHENETLVVKYEGEAVPKPKTSARLENPMVKGTIDIEVPSTGERKRVRFSLPFRANW